VSGSSAMRTFGVCLWKEWRDHRAVLLGLVVAIPLVLALLGVALPSRTFEYGGFARYTALACLATFVISLTTDLAPGEARRGHRWLLERLPGGLGAPILAKLLLFVAGATLFPIYGHVAGALTCRLVTGYWPDPPASGTITGILAVAALWTFAVSCSLPRGALSLPATAALALLLGIPILVLREIDPTWGPSPWWRWESVVLWGVGGAVAAWAAFRRTGFLRAGRACLAVGAVCATPYWADAFHHPFCPDASIVHGYLGEGGRYVFVDRIREPRDETGRWRALPPVILDLETGIAREMRSDHRWLRPLSGWNTSQRYLQLGADVFDGRTGERVRVTERDIGDGCRANTPWRLPDGRRIWVAGQRLEADAADGGVEVLVEPWTGSGRRGLGFEIVHGFYDPTRRRSFKRRELAIHRYQVVLIRPGRWLVGRSYGMRRELYDPESNSLAPALGLEPEDWVGAMLDDGRVFVTRGEAVLLLDPETGATTPIDAPAGVRVGYIGDRRTPDGRRILHLFWYRERRDPRLARFDPATGTLAVTAPLDGYGSFVGCPTDDTAIAHDREAIYRLRFGSDEKEEIWRAR
jgi:hypothetical protein